MEYAKWVKGPPSCQPDGCVLAWGISCIGELDWAVPSRERALRVNGIVGWNLLAEQLNVDFVCDRGEIESLQWEWNCLLLEMRLMSVQCSPAN